MFLLHDAETANSNGPSLCIRITVIFLHGNWDFSHWHWQNSSSLVLKETFDSIISHFHACGFWAHTHTSPVLKFPSDIFIQCQLRVGRAVVKYTYLLSPGCNGGTAGDSRRQLPTDWWIVTPASLLLPSSFISSLISMTAVSLRLLLFLCFAPSKSLTRENTSTFLLPYRRLDIMWCLIQKAHVCNSTTLLPGGRKTHRISYLFSPNGTIIWNIDI